MVCELLVAIVTAFAELSIFLNVYSLPAMPDAVGKVNVTGLVVALPVKTLSVDVTV